MQSQKISCPDSLDRQYLRQYLGIYKILLPTSHTSKSSMWPNGLSPLMRWLAIVLSAYASEVVMNTQGSTSSKEAHAPCLCTTDPHEELSSHKYALQCSIFMTGISSVYPLSTNKVKLAGTNKAVEHFCAYTSISEKQSTKI